MNDQSPQKPLHGKAIRHLWSLDPDFLTVNHGSFGAAPNAVLEKQAEWRRTLEAQPTRFMRQVYPQAIRAAAGRLAAFVGADPRDLAFVENATQGCNAVLRSLRFEAGDEILGFDHGYGAVRNTARFVAERAGGRLVEAKLPFPNPTDDGIVAALEAAITARTKLVVVDHITSPSALILPVRRLAEVARKAGVPILVDGAHGPGQVDLDVPALGCDWYSGNCHKWLSAPKGAAFLWARRDRQADLHPVTISHGFGKGFVEEFDWVGTRDATAAFVVPDAIDFHDRLGGAAHRRRNADLAAAGATILADALGTERAADPAMHGSMALARLPAAGPATQERALALRDRLLHEFATDVPLHALGGAIWIRLSAAAYNEEADYVELARRCRRLVGQGN